MKKGEVYIDASGGNIMKYRVDSVRKNKNINVTVLRDDSGIWYEGEKDVFNHKMCVDDKLDKESNIKKLLAKIDGKNDKIS